jgi:hypothetical protein
MKLKVVAILMFSIALIVFACKEPFNQKTPANSVDYLVVEGIINTAGTTNISLTRSLKLSDKVVVKGELKAAVQVEGETSGVFPIAEKTNGLYSVSGLTLNASQKYRLRIKTAAGKIYLSDFVTIKTTPAIDSVSWEQTNKGVEIYANAHDSKKETRYYQWDYEEDWELRSRAASVYTTIDRQLGGLSLILRPSAQVELLRVCYRNTKSAVLSLFSTAKLDNDLVYKFPLQSIPNGSDKFEFKYSMLVKQYAISREAFEYLTLMKKNSESGGSLFDSQPTEIKGNIHNAADANETVIGFVQIASVIEKRIWIMPSQLPTWKLSLGCNFVDVKNNSDSLTVYFGANDSGAAIPTDATELNTSTGVPSRVGGATSACMDCRLRGGTNIKPIFW